ncbi:MAG: zinc ABC transporter substrate-binding protein [Desulfobacteraceae bacterium]|nr:zinc ABC transporter substrate-binding protein [Desulfobacteraceae bacterium]
MKICLKLYILLTAALIWLLPLNTFAKAPLNVHVSILPQKYFVERIGRDLVSVNVLVKPGKSPATYSPSPDQIKKLTSSDVYFRIGVPFENSILHKIKSIAKIMIVDTRKDIVLRMMEGYNHDGRDQNKRIGNDPHIWMNPLMVKTQAHTIFKTLSNMDPDNKDGYKKNYKQFVKDLDGLDNRLKTALKNLKGENLFVFHPSFGYFTDAYGLKQVAIESMGKAPKVKALSNIIKLAKKQKTRMIFAQPQFDRNAAEKIASAIKGVVVLIDPLAYDYLGNMEKIAQSITRVLKK